MLPRVGRMRQRPHMSVRTTASMHALNSSVGFSYAHQLCHSLSSLNQCNHHFSPCCPGRNLGWCNIVLLRKPSQLQSSATMPYGPGSRTMNVVSAARPPRCGRTGLQDPTLKAGRAPQTRHEGRGDAQTRARRQRRARAPRCHDVRCIQGEGALAACSPGLRRGDDRTGRPVTTCTPRCAPAQFDGAFVE